MEPKEELVYLREIHKVAQDKIWEAAHFLGLGTPTAYCTVQEAFDKTFDRISELEDELGIGHYQRVTITDRKRE